MLTENKKESAVAVKRETIEFSKKRYSLIPPTWITSRSRKRGSSYLNPNIPGMGRAGLYSGLNIYLIDDTLTQGSYIYLPKSFFFTTKLYGSI